MRKFLHLKKTVHRILMLSMMLIFVGSFAQVFYLNIESEPPKRMSVCDGETEFKARVVVSSVNTTESTALVKVVLPQGIEYVPNSLVLESASTGLSFVHAGGTAGTPQFKINKGSALKPADEVVFKFKKVARCAAIDFIGTGGVFSDRLEATIQGYPTVTTQNNNTYEVIYPELTFLQPQPKTNAELNTPYERTFTIKNGGYGCTDKVYLTVDYPDNGIELLSLKINVNGSLVDLTPTSIQGTKRIYEISGSQYFPANGGKLCNGEVITVHESYKLKVCKALTNYTVGWGCEGATWCRTVTGKGEVAMATGTPNLNEIGFKARPDYVDACTPFTQPVYFKNNGKGSAKAAGMYNIQPRLGGGPQEALEWFDWKFYNVQEVTINGNPISFTGGDSQAILVLNIKDKFKTDPDGLGVGLDDLDGDGFYDDLPAGATLNVNLKIKINCNYNNGVCGPAYSQNMTYGVHGDALYTTMCDPQTVLKTNKVDVHKFSGVNGEYNIGRNTHIDLRSTSYGPANVYGGTPFTVRFSFGAFSMRNPFDTSKTRYQYEITLPQGVSLVNGGNVKWYNFFFPTVNQPVPGAKVEQIGNIVRITSPREFIGHTFVDFVYTCGTSEPFDIPFKVKRIDNIQTGCATCNDELVCDKVSISKVICPSPCAEGASINYANVERPENSIGWTDHTLTTRMKRNEVPIPDLKKALYLDELEVEANGVQNGVGNDNLHLKMVIAKYEGTDNKLMPKKIVVTIKRGGAVLNTATITNYTSTGTDDTQQVIDWDITSAFPNGQLMAGDVVETKAYYEVVSNNLPRFDKQTGKTIYFYNLKNGQEKSCRDLVPEMYLAGTKWSDIHNRGSALTVQACESKNIGHYTNHYAVRFDPNGVVFQKENRPGFKPLKYEFIVPEGYVLDRLVRSNRYPFVRTPQIDDIDVTSELTVVGNTYTYEFKDEIGYAIPVENGYNLLMGVYLKPSCDTPASGRELKTKLTYVPYYYHYKDSGLQHPTEVAEKSLPIAYNVNTRPSVKLINQTGTIQATKPVESAVIRMASTGTSLAPYTWLSIPNKQGITIVGLVDMETGQELTPLNYSGGVWFKLSENGLASGLYKDYKVKFKYTTCEVTSFEVQGGWNCSSYPVDPSAYTCSKESVEVKFAPLPSALQIKETKVPNPQGVEMCDAVEYGFSILSSGAANIVGGDITINLPQGLTIPGNTIRLEYPLGSGIFSDVPYVQNQGVVTLDLSKISNFPADGIPGTVHDGGSEANRTIGVTLRITSNCSFIVGSKFDLTVRGKSACDGSTIATTQSAELSIIGTKAEYTVISKFELIGAFDNCAGEVAYRLNQTIISSKRIDDTAEAQIEIPQGYVFKEVICNSANCIGTVPGTYVDPNNGKTYLTLKIPGGLDNGDVLNYDVVFKREASQAYPPCQVHQVSVRTMDKKVGIRCTSSGEVCPEVLILTSNQTFDYEIKKPTYSIDALTGTLSNGTFKGAITVTNTSQLDYDGTNPIKVRFYCADQNDQPGVLLGSHDISMPIAQGTTITSNFNVSTTEACPSSKIIALIDDVENCTCQDAQGLFSLSCYKPGVLNGEVLDTNHGITSLSRAGAENGNWPMVRKGAWTVLESKTKGFVVNRLTDEQIARLPSSGLVEGMMVYNITQKCLMINIDGTATGWKCYNTPACPD